MSENIYRKKCEEFVKKYNISMELLSKKKMKWFDDELETKRNVYKIRLKKGKKSWTFEWADSLLNTENKEKPDLYDVLSTISKFDAKDYKKWCAKYNFDYKNEDKYLKIFNKINKEVNDAKKFFGDAFDEFVKIV